MSKEKRQKCLAEFEKMLAPEFESGVLYRMDDSPSIQIQSAAMCRELAKYFGFPLQKLVQQQIFYRLEGELLHVLAMAPSWELPSEGRYFLCSDLESPEFRIGGRVSVESGVKLCMWKGQESPLIQIPYSIQSWQIKDLTPGPSSREGQILRQLGALGTVLSLADACINLRLKSFGYLKRIVRTPSDPLSLANQEAEEFFVETLERARKAVPLNMLDSRIELEPESTSKILPNEEVEELLFLQLSDKKKTGR